MISNTIFRKPSQKPSKTNLYSWSLKSTAYLALNVSAVLAQVAASMTRFLETGLLESSAIAGDGASNTIQHAASVAVGFAFVVLAADIAVFMTGISATSASGTAGLFALAAIVGTAGIAVVVIIIGGIAYLAARRK